MTALNDAEIEQLRQFTRRLRELLPPLQTLAGTMAQQPAHATVNLRFSADLFPGLSRQRSSAGDEAPKATDYIQLVTEIEAGLREMEVLLRRGEYSAHLLERCELLGRQSASLLVAMKQQQRHTYELSQVPSLAGLVGQDKTRMAMQRLQQHIVQQAQELQQLQRLQDQVAQELRWQQGASASRRQEIQLRLQSYTNRIEQITREIAYSRDRLENIRHYQQRNKPR